MNSIQLSNRAGVVDGVKRHSRKAIGKALAWGIGVTMLISAPAVQAYPPAPHHLFFGMVRDELGNPLRVENAEVLFETATGARLRTELSYDHHPGANYRLEVPMDAGVTAEAYKPTALRPTVPFTMRVRVGSKVLLPIELAAHYSAMGEPGMATRLDLTLGEDSDGDGLPDAWERQLIQSLDDLDSLADVNGLDDADGDGLSNLQEYLSGNYAFDDESGFSLEIKGVSAEGVKLEFMALRGRSYSIQGSETFEDWTELPFTLPEEEEEGAYTLYQSDDVHRAQVTVPFEDGAPQYRFFKLMVQ